MVDGARLFSRAAISGPSRTALVVRLCLVAVNQQQWWYYSGRPTLRQIARVRALMVALLPRN
ncbi:hypothetical protein NECAME_06898 [Necator americanus]|uniref:Uncharacterized protein n=1 Tax=Necator americanus TaxID=51031 RepID=W2TTA5_NECAM|nr:hypothetical protein NECAME_06898 [Necator americanus]ETN84336.1 hypothetical protein NECAME_06898 [Necator americanus]